MKTIRFTVDAAKDLRTYKGQAKRITKKLADYAERGAGNVKALTGDLAPAKRLRAGDYRVIFVETEEVITVTKIAPRGTAYD